MGSQTKAMKTVASLGVLSLVGQALTQVNYQRGAAGGFGGSFGSPAAGGIGSLEDTIPGTPGEDYPIYAVPPETSFTCDGQVDGGYYGNPGLSKFSFLCPNGTLFQQQYFVCDWWFNVDCSTTEDFYGLNDEIAAERAAISPGGGQSQYGGPGAGVVAARLGGSAQHSGGRPRTGGAQKTRSRGSQASASAPRGSYSSPSGSSSSSYSAPSSDYNTAQDSFGAGSGYGAPSGAGAGAGYGAPGSLGGYSSRRNARGIDLVGQQSDGEDAETEG